MGFTGSLKGLVKAELPAAFLVALDEYCEGEIPEHVWRIGRTRTDKDSMATLRQRVAVAMKEQSAEASGKTRKKDSTRKGGTSHDTMQDSPEGAVPPL